MAASTGGHPPGAGGSFPSFGGSSGFGGGGFGGFGGGPPPYGYPLPLGGPPPEVLVSPEHMHAYAANCRRTLHYAVS
jgi:hypothetical protein